MNNSPIENEITQLIKVALNPHHFMISNDSKQHRGPRDAESHFSATIVSDHFVNQSQVLRQQKIFSILSDIMPKIHALSLRTATVDEWHSQCDKQLDLPRCKNKTA